RVAPAGGPKPPASARPAHGGRFSPAGAGAGLSGIRASWFPVAPSRDGRGKRGAFPVPARPYRVVAVNTPWNAAPVLAPATEKGPHRRPPPRYRPAAGSALFALLGHDLAHFRQRHLPAHEGVLDHEIRRPAH